MCLRRKMNSKITNKSNITWLGKCKCKCYKIKYRGSD